ncbi:MAG: prepilin-type N-terminal cleavage/methylation domain-containing protein [Patescibacteria group bacterium]
MERVHEAGFSLFEILIAISVFAVVGVVAAQLVGVSVQQNSASGQKTIGVKLVQETMNAVNAIATGQWHNIYGLTKGSGNHYYPVISAGAWTTAAGDELLTVNDLAYTRYFYVENVTRDSGGAIVNSGGTDDPSTQRVTAVASWANSGIALGAATTTQYITRSRNTAAIQTNWATSGQSANPSGGEDIDFNTQYATDDGNVDTTGGSIKLEAQ